MDSTTDQLDRIWIADEVAHAIRVISKDRVQTAAGFIQATPASSHLAADGLAYAPKAADGPRVPCDGNANGESVFCSPNSVVFLAHVDLVLISERNRSTLRILDLATSKVSTLLLTDRVPDNLDNLRLSSSSIGHFPNGPHLVRLTYNMPLGSFATCNVNIRTGACTLIDKNLYPLANFVKQGVPTTLWYGKGKNWMEWDFLISELPSPTQALETADALQVACSSKVNYTWLCYSWRHRACINFYNQRLIIQHFSKIRPDAYIPAQAALSALPNGFGRHPSSQQAPQVQPHAYLPAWLGQQPNQPSSSSAPSSQGKIDHNQPSLSVASPSGRGSSPHRNPSSSSPTSSNNGSNPGNVNGGLVNSNPPSVIYRVPPSSLSNSSSSAFDELRSSAPLAPLPGQAPLSYDGFAPSHAPPPLVSLSPISDMYSEPAKRVRLERFDLSSILGSALNDDLVIQHSITKRLWVVHREVLRIHTDADLDEVVRQISGSFFPEATVDALIRYLYCQPLANPADLENSSHLASHIIFLWRYLGFFNIEFLLFEYANTIVHNMPADVACSSLLKMWSDEFANWNLEDEPVKILTSYVRERCRQDFLNAASDCDLPSKRLVPLVSNVTSALIAHMTVDPAYSPSLPGLRLDWRRTRIDESIAGSNFEDTQEGALVDSPEKLLRNPTDFVFGFDSSSPYRHCWIVASGVYLFPQWQYFKRLVTSALAEASTRIIRMPHWVTANILLSILRPMHCGKSPSFILLDAEALTLLEHARELELVDDAGAPVGCFVNLLNKCFDHSFPPTSDANILLHYTKFSRLRMDPKLDELALTLSRREIPQIMARVAKELSYEQIADLFIRIKAITSQSGRS